MICTAVFICALSAVPRKKVATKLDFYWAEAANNGELG